MHLLVVALGFPSPQNPYPGSFIGQQVRFLSDCPDLAYITVLCPTTVVPGFLQRFRRLPAPPLLPQPYEMVQGRCTVVFPRYYKLPGDWLLRWTLRQWCRLLDDTIESYAQTRPVSVIHANYGGVSSWAAVLVAKRRQIPCVVTYQGGDV